LAKQAETVSRRQLGLVNISPDAIGMVAGIAALQCFGVVGMASRTIQDGISELLTGKDNLTKGIEVTIDDERVLLDLYIIVEYGVQIKEVAHNVLQAVRYAILNQFSLQVAKVNVIVQGVRIEK
jgi:uncharacterized alkaline shock family protein YloU